MTLGQKIRQARLDRGLTQKQLVGDHITRNMLSKIENDSATPSMRTLEFLASQLGMTPGYFVDGTEYSDGSSPDGLDDMRRAYREGQYVHCIRLLEQHPSVATTDEGYLLHAKSALGAAHEALQVGDVRAAKEYADRADYYNKESIYYSPAIDAEMSLILAECALVLDLNEYEHNAQEFERSVGAISFSGRYRLSRAEYLVRTGRTQEAWLELEKAGERDSVRSLLVEGMCRLSEGDSRGAIPLLLKAEAAALGSHDKSRIYQQLEIAYRNLEDYKMAYTYAARQLREE